MKPYEKRIRVILDVPKETAAYLELMKQWENEGGAINIKQNSEVIPEANLPFREGDVFRVVSGTIDFIEEEVYYLVDIIKENSE